MVTPGLVSIVVVAYNNWPDLELAIQSALHQSYRPIEIVVVDNSSTDETSQEVPRRFGDRVRYIRQPNLKDSGAYNRGIRETSGEFVQLLDGDDVLTPIKIEKQMETFQADPAADIVFSESRAFLGTHGLPNWIEEPTPDVEDVLVNLMEGNFDYGPLSALYRRSALERVGPWDETLYVTDLDYNLRAAWAGCCFRHCRFSPLAFCRKHPKQLTANLYAMRHGWEDVLVKALGYITRDPYRRLISEKLARQRFALALTDELPASEALARIDSARQVNPDAVSPMGYAIARALILLPGGRNLARSARFASLRRRVASAVGFRYRA